MSMGIGIPELLIVFLPFLIILVIGPLIGLGIFLGLVTGKRAKRLGYASTRQYLRAAPRTDEERRDAADLVMRGLVCCMLGFLLPPIVLVGLIPLFYGGRKLVYAALGLGLVDDGEQPRA